MKLFHTLLVSVLFTAAAEAQECASPGPGNSTVISQNTTLGSGSYWICPSTSVTFTGFAFAWLEDGCNATIDGMLDNYSFKPNCTVTVNGNNNVVVHDNTTTVVDNGTSTFATLCDEVTFDYSNAPSDGCAVVTGIRKASCGPRYWSPRIPPRTC
jgi:hypothetical protein